MVNDLQHVRNCLTAKVGDLHSCTLPGSCRFHRRLRHRHELCRSLEYSTIQQMSATGCGFWNVVKCMNIPDRRRLSHSRPRCLHVHHPSKSHDRIHLCPRLRRSKVLGCCLRPGRACNTMCSQSLDENDDDWIEDTYSFLTVTTGLALIDLTASATWSTCAFIIMARTSGRIFGAALLT